MSSHLYFTMKTTRNLLSVLLAAGAPGVALLAISNVIPADVAMSILAVGSLAAFAAFDYARQAKSLRVSAPVLRPALPVAGATCASVHDLRRAA
jgi:hypothetical protein